MMETFLFNAMVVMGLSSFLSFLRFLRGPTSADRVVAADTIATHIIALLILFCMRQGSAVYYYAVLVLTILGFVRTLTFGKYLIGQGNILDPYDSD